VYVVLFPAPDDLEEVVLSETLAANKLGGTSETAGKTFELGKNIVLATGGEYTFTTWLLITNYDERRGLPKHVFDIYTTPKTSTAPSTRPDHKVMVGILYPSENKLAIRVYHEKETGSTDTPSTNLSLNSTMSSVFGGTGISTAFGETVGVPICDVTNIDLQKWICLTVVVNGRVIDVYIDGKLARSCVTKGIPTVEGGPATLVIGRNKGWGGSISTTRIFGYALTPGKIYEIYQSGPANPGQYGFLGWLYKRLKLDELQANIAYYSGYDNAYDYIYGNNK